MARRQPSRPSRNVDSFLRRLAAHGKKFAFYYYEVSNGEDTLMFSPTEYVDISGVEARKRAACYAHASQTPDRILLTCKVVLPCSGVLKAGTNRLRHTYATPRALTTSFRRLPKFHETPSSAPVSCRRGARARE